LDPLREHLAKLHVRFEQQRRAGEPGTVQELLGHADVRATMLYTHVLGKGAMGVKSPLDRPP
jgi:integrase